MHNDLHPYLNFAAALCVGCIAVCVWLLARRLGRLERAVEEAMDVGGRRHQAWSEGSAQMLLRIESLRQAMEHADAEANVRRMLRGAKAKNKANPS